MTLKSLFDQELHATHGPRVVAVKHDGTVLRCEITAIDALGVSFRKLTLETLQLAGVSLAQLERIAKRLSEKLSYLLEPVEPIEADALTCTVQMRSNPPQKDDDGSSYYELLVKAGGELSLERYRKEPGAKRTPLDATVTREVLLRLAGDFSTAVQDH
ncbi:MAG: hypothetical protein WD851_08835 [Pirellulales bacterium]